MPSDYAAWAANWRVPLGFVLGVAYLIFSQPTRTLLVTGGSIAFVGLMLRAWSAGHLAKNQRLATSGPYACTRNPLYLGSSVMGLGFAVAGGSWLVGAAFVAFFFAVYWPVIRREEKALRQEYGEAYARYEQNVPLFFPRIQGAFEGGESFRWEQYRRNREYEAALGYVACVVFLALKSWLR
jgi:protein-S-isoprenylcysteine O-methyltransferase Ste14